MDLMLDALDVMMKNDAIVDRPTLLTARLVCREWRNMRAFSEKISSVTLHRLADMQLAARLFPRGGGNSRSFPSLSTLRITHSLSLELSRCREAVSWFDACEVFEVEVLAVDFADLTKLTAFYRKINMGSSLHVIFHEIDRMTLLRTMLGVFDGFPLLRKMRVEVKEAEPIDASTWIALAVVLVECSTIQHLQVDGVRVNNCPEFGSFLVLLSQLKHVTRIDLSMFLRFSSEGEVGMVDAVMEKFAPENLHDYKLNISWVRPSGAAYVVIKESSRLGPKQTCSSRAKARVRDSRKFDEEACRHLSRALRQGPAPKRLEICLEVHRKVPVDKYLIDVTVAAPGLQELVIHLFYMSCEGDDTENRTGPSFRHDPGFQLDVTKMLLRFSFEGNGRLLDPSPMVKQLPSLCSRLEHLELKTDTCLLSDHTCLTQLTKLTHLTFHNTYDPYVHWHPLGLTSFPPSLRELVVHGDDLTLTALSGLQHLTKLAVRARAKRHTFEAVYASDAPLRHLCMYGAPRHVDLSKISVCFPMLEILDVHLNLLTNIDSLASLRSLQEVKFMFPDVMLGGVYWLKKLTWIQVLTVENTNPSLKAFEALGTLTRLRSLCYRLQPNLCRFGQMSQDPADAVKVLRRKLPYTQVQVFNRGRLVTV